MSKAVEHVRYLVDVIGYREPTSEGERWASKYIAGVLKGLGVEHQVESFQTCRTYSYPQMIVLGAALLGSLLSGASGFLGFVLTAAAAAAFYMEYTGKSWVDQLPMQDPSQNVVARIPARGEVRRRVVLCAHYDTSRSGLSFHPRFAGSFRTVTLVTVVSVFGLPVSILLGCMFWSGLFELFRELATLVLFLNILLLLHREVYGKDVYGANDNASGVGVVLSLAEMLAREPLDQTEVWIVTTGSEEAGAKGMLAFMDRHGQELENALIVNIDQVGAGLLKYITGEGMLTAFPSDPELLMLSAETVREAGDLPMVPHEFRTFFSDAYAALVRGYRAMSVMAFDEEGVIPNWHWETDVPGNLDESNLVDVERFVGRLVKKIDKET